MRKFIFSPDKHVGWERKQGKLVALHDAKAIGAMMEFARDFKPDVWIEGGDNLDCGPISHHLSDKKVSVQQLDLSKDAREYTKLVLEPLMQILPKGAEKVWMNGNHEDWLAQLGELQPGLASLLTPEHLLDLRGWKIIPQGGYVKYGYLHFVHGDAITGGTNCAKNAVARYGQCIRFGHFHTFQVATQHSMLNVKDVKTGIAVPSLCRRNPNYLKGAPSQWTQGFNYGYLHDDGTFTDYVPIIVNGRFSAHGTTYVG